MTVCSKILAGVLCAAALCSAVLHAADRADIVVARDGSGRFTTIQAALDAVDADAAHPRVILIKNGTYNEKLYIRKSHVTLVGEDRNLTRIVYAELREEWNRDHNGSDWGAGVINIDTASTDITLANMTVLNNHGSLYGTHNKHSFTIRGYGTRIILLYCNVISDGGDALSLWNRQNGMYYHSDCYFEGWVDYVCPRGWCYITNSQFFGHNKPSASLWHDGGNDKKQKFVIANSTIDGVAGFPLGRNHRDGQLYFLHCNFSPNMADRPFYRPPSSTTEWVWGDRHYFYDCHREGGDYSWFKDNLESADGAPRPEQINAKWAFDGKWDPEGTMSSVLPFATSPSPARSASGVGSRETVLAWNGGRNALSHRVCFGKTAEPAFVREQKETQFMAGQLEPKTTYYWRVNEVTPDSTITGEIWSFTTR
jgi:pectinesterase